MTAIRLRVTVIIVTFAGMKIYSGLAVRRTKQVSTRMKIAYVPTTWGIIRTVSYVADLTHSPG